MAENTAPAGSSAAAAAAAAAAKPNYQDDPALYLYTSLTGGNMHLVTATSRLETILRANRVPFKGLDLATDNEARKLWGRRAGKDAKGRPRKLPALMQNGQVLGDIVEIEEWNEYGELKDHVKIYYDEFTIPKKSDAAKPDLLRRGAAKPLQPKTNATGGGAAPNSSSSKSPAGPAQQQKPAADGVPAPIRGVAGALADEAAQKAKQLNMDKARVKVHGSQETKEGSASLTPTATATGAATTTEAEKGTITTTTKKEEAKVVSDDEEKGPEAAEAKPADGDTVADSSDGSEKPEPKRDATSQPAPPGTATAPSQDAATTTPEATAVAKAADTTDVSSDAKAARSDLARSQEDPPSTDVTAAKEDPAGPTPEAGRPADPVTHASAGEDRKGTEPEAVAVKPPAGDTVSQDVVAKE